MINQRVYSSIGCRKSDCLYGWMFLNLMPFLLVKNIYCTIQLGVVIAVSLWCHFNVLRVSTFNINHEERFTWTKITAEKSWASNRFSSCGKWRGKEIPAVMKILLLRQIFSHHTFHKGLCRLSIFLLKKLLVFDFQKYWILMKNTIYRSCHSKSVLKIQYSSNRQ